MCESNLKVITRISSLQHPPSNALNVSIKSSDTCTPMGGTKMIKGVELARHYVWGWGGDVLGSKNLAVHLYSLP